MAREKVEDMIRKGYMVFEANTEYAGQPWELPANVLADFTAVFNELRALDAAATESQTQKENACAKGAAEQVKCEQILWDLKKFIRVVQPDKDLQGQMFHDLGIEDKLPVGDSDFLKVLYEQVKPHLDDWDGSPQEIPADTKTAINAQITAYSTAVGGCDEWKANATTATEAVHQATAAFVNERARVRNWLYLKLPDQKYDAHLDEYGFDIWNKPTYGGGEEPGVTAWDAKPIASAKIAPVPLTGLLMGCETYEGTVRFDIKIASAKKNFPPPTMPDNDYVTDVEQPVFIGLNFPLQKGYVYYGWIRARKDGEVSEWSDPAGIEWTEEAGGVPVVPE